MSQEFSNFFQKSYCINLDRRKDRWNKIQKTFSEQNLQVERYSAFDAQKLNQQIGTAKERGRYACTESHYGVIRQAKEENLKNVMIFEDDAILPDNFSQQAQDYLELIPINWSIIMIGYYMARNFPKQIITNQKIFKIPKNQTKSDGLWATHAYAINSNIYSEILECPNGGFSLEPHKEGDDGYGCIDITYYYKFHGFRDCYAFNPSLVDQEKGDSDINI